MPPVTDPNLIAHLEKQAPAPAATDSSGLKLIVAPRPKTPTPGQTWRQMTPKEVNARGYDPKGVYQISDTGEVKPIGGQNEGKPTEAENTALFLAKRVAGGIGDINTVLSTNPGAARPGIISSIASLAGETAHNFMTSSDRQRIEAAQLDVLDAALTLGTGAAYTKEQIEGYRKSYFPALGDSEATVKDKSERLLRLLEAARSKAGRAGPELDSAITTLRGGGEGWKTLPSGLKVRKVR